MARVRILYLEDSTTDADLVRRKLGSSGIDLELRVASTPQQLNDALHAGGIDMVISDHAMPGFTGRHALEMTQRLRPGLPVMLLSSRIDPDEASICLEAGAFDYLSKGDLWKLPHAIRRATRAIEPVRNLRVDPPAHADRDGWHMLVGVIQQLSLTRSLPAIVQIVRSAARRLVNADGATFVLRDGDKCYYVDEDAISPLWKGKRFMMSVCISGWVMINRRPTVIEDIYKDSRIPAEAYRPTFVRSLAMVPIRSDAPLGAIGAYWATQYAPTREQVALLSSLANATSLAMENVDVYETLERRVQDRTTELRSANKELEAFSYSVSHDLRSPVNAVKGYAQHLLETRKPDLDDETIDVLNRVETAGKHMESLIESLLALAKFSLSDVVREPVDLTAMARSVVDGLKEQEQNQSITVTIQPGLAASGDASMIRIVLENLISNAMKFSRKRAQPEIEIGMTKDPIPVFFVRDNGVGFDMQYARQLFAPFHRLHAQEEFPGTGVGLATVQRIVHRHGGEIWADSTLGQGATFSFTLGSLNANA